MIKYSPVKRSPHAGGLAAGFKGVVGPRVAGVKHVVFAVGFVKSVAGAIVGICFYVDDIAGAVSFKAPVNKSY
jgi:hypothetical protein